MPDDYQELDVFGRPKSKVAGVPYVNVDDEDAALRNYTAGLPIRELVVDPQTGFEYYRTVVPGRDAPVQGVHDYVPGQAAADWARANPVKFFPGLDRTPIELDTWDNIKNKIFGPRQGQTVNTLGRSVRMPARATFDERFGVAPDERTQPWAEKMIRSGVSLPGDVYEGRVRADFSRPGDFSDDPMAPNPLAPLIERTQDLAGLAAGGSLATGVRPELPSRLSNALGKGYTAAKRVISTLSDDELGTAISGLQGRKDLTEGSFGGNVPPSIARNIGRETMPEILARQRASEGYEAAIRDPETKKLYTGMWHEEVLDKIAKDRGIPKDQLPANLKKGYVDYDGKFWTEQQVENKSRSRTAMFRADDEVGAAVAAMNASEGKAPQLKPAEAAPTGNLPAVIPPQGVAAPGSAINPISNRRGFLRGARDLMAAASNANKIVTIAEKLGKPVEMPIPKHPKVPLKEIWKTEGEYPEHVIESAEEYAREMLNTKFEDAHPQFAKHDWGNDAWEKKYNKAWDEFTAKDPEFKEIVENYAGEWDGEKEGGTQFSHNQLPGATNYREHLMQMPERTRDLVDVAPGTEAERNWFKNRENAFYGSFDEPDIIGHTRVNDRTLKGGEKSLHVEEAGSELHETGRKYGYRKPEKISDKEVEERASKAFNEEYAAHPTGKNAWSRAEQATKDGRLAIARRELEAERVDNTLKQLPPGFKLKHEPIKSNSIIADTAKGNWWVEDAEGNYAGGRHYLSADAAVKTALREFSNRMPADLPFKSTHMDLSVNRMLHEAATQGYDALSWTPHDIQKKLYGNDSNKDFHARIEAIAKKYGGKIEKEEISGAVPEAETIEKVNGLLKKANPKGNVTWETLSPKAREDWRKSVGDEPTSIHTLKLTPDMKRIFGHDDFSFFPKTSENGYDAFEQPGFKLRSDSEAGAAVGALRNSADRPYVIKPPTLAEATAYAKEMAGGELDWKRHTPEAQQEWLRRAYDQIVKQRERAADGVKAPTFYSGLARTLERAPFEEATPTQWAKYLRDTVGARQAEEFEHVGLADKVGKLEEEKKAVERPAQGALDAWKTTNPRQRPPKELMDAASTENKRIVEQKLKDRDTDKPLTKKELLAHVGDNQPKFKEIVKKGEEHHADEAITERAHEIMDENHPNVTPQHAEYYDYFDDAWNEAKTELSYSPAKYSDYQLPGGTNYREHLTTMPERKPAPYVDPTMDYVHELNQKYGDRWTRATITSAERAKLSELDNKRVSPVNENHYSSHWNEPNVIVHTRMNDRVLSNEAPKIPTFEEWSKRQKGVETWSPEKLKKEYEIEKQKGVIPNDFSKDGLKSLHAEEFQSDLHQEGRKKGYKDPSFSQSEFNKEEASIQKAIREHEDKNPGFDTFRDKWPDDLDRRYKKLYKRWGSVPDFPFKKSWPDLAIKRWLREAVDNDYDAVSWTPGEAQRDRFRLSHHIEDLHYDKLPNGDYILGGQQKGGDVVHINRGVPIKEADLSRYVGEAVAEKIKKGEGKYDDAEGAKILNNEDLKVGGEGLVSFYDKTVKAKVQALVEKHGGKVEKHNIENKKNTIEPQYDSRGVVGGNIVGWVIKSDEGRFSNRYASRAEAEKALQHKQHDAEDKFVWSVKLNPELKRAIRSEGFPLFSSGLPLVPVDHDPFDEKKGKKLRLRLEPVEHDPFAIPTPDMGGALNKLVSEEYRPKPRPIQNGFGVRNEGAR